eukprot:11045086-Karenia_brevis.AAC.1
MSNATARGHPEFFELGVEVDGPIHRSLAASPGLSPQSLSPEVCLKDSNSQDLQVLHPEVGMLGPT